MNILFNTFIATIWLFPNFVDLNNSNLYSNGIYLIRVKGGDMKSISKKDAETLKTNQSFHACGMEQSCMLLADNPENGIQLQITEDIKIAVTKKWKNIWMKINPGNFYTFIFAPFPFHSDSN